MRGIPTSPYKKVNPQYHEYSPSPPRIFSNNRVQTKSVQQAIKSFYVAKNKHHNKTKFAQIKSKIINTAFYDNLVMIFHPQKRTPLLIFIFGVALFFLSYFSNGYGRFILFGIYPFNGDVSFTEDNLSNRLNRMSLVLGGILIIFGFLWYFSVEYKIDIETECKNRKKKRTKPKRNSTKKKIEDFNRGFKTTIRTVMPGIEPSRVEIKGTENLMSKFKRKFPFTDADESRTPNKISIAEAINNRKRELKDQNQFDLPSLVKIVTKNTNSTQNNTRNTSLTSPPISKIKLWKHKCNPKKVCDHSKLQTSKCFVGNSQNLKVNQHELELSIFSGNTNSHANSPCIYTETSTERSFYNLFWEVKNLSSTKMTLSVSVYSVKTNKSDSLIHLFGQKLMNEKVKNQDAANKIE